MYSKIELLDYIKKKDVRKEKKKITATFSLFFSRAQTVILFTPSLGGSSIEPQPSLPNIYTCNQATNQPAVIFLTLASRAPRQTRSRSHPQPCPLI